MRVLVETGACCYMRKLFKGSKVIYSGLKDLYNITKNLQKMIHGFHNNNNTGHSGNFFSLQGTVALTLEMLNNDCLMNLQ